MKYIETSVIGVYMVELEKRIDERGSFARAFCQEEFEEQGLSLPISQCNLATTNHAGTMRGLHYQVSPDEESKLVRCISGAVYDVCVDMRPDSPTYKKWTGVELSRDNQRAVFVPPGIAHGYLTLEDDVQFYYMVSAKYAPESERGIRWDDPALDIKWPLTPTIVSDKDQSWPLM